MNTYVLKNKVEISDFDSYEANRYLLSYDNRYWNISYKFKVVVTELKKEKTLEELNETINDKYSVDLCIEDVRKIISFLKYNGLLAGTDEKTDSSKQSMLWGRFTILPSNLIKRLEVLKMLQKKSIIISLSIIIIISNAFLIYVNRENFSLQLRQFMNLRSILGFVLINGILILWHEIGHATALMKFKLYPIRIGGGVYITKPVMFTDVTESWKLSRKERQYVNIGGVYFQGILATVMLLIFTVFGLTIEMNIILYSNLLMLANLNIFIKSDGYWFFSDFMGIHNLHKVAIQKLPFFRYRGYKIGVGNTIIIYTYLSIFMVVVVLIGITVGMNAYTSIIVITELSKRGINNYQDIMEILFSTFTFILFILFVRVIIKYTRYVIQVGKGKV